MNRVLSAFCISILICQASLGQEKPAVITKAPSAETAVVDFDAMIKMQQKSIDQIFTDQGRLRENMKALKGSADEKTLLQRYTKQLDEEETQLDRLRKGKQVTETEQQLANRCYRR
jgi:hypothetical protein